VSTVHYADLSLDMAMKIGRDYSSEKVTPQDFERLAEEAGLAKPLVKRRVPDLADTVIVSLTQTDLSHPEAEAVAAIITRRCEDIRNRFQNK